MLTENENCDIYIYNIENGVNTMLNEEICKLREKLNASIMENRDYSIIYKLSVELDNLIAEYYLESQKMLNKR